MKLKKLYNKNFINFYGSNNYSHIFFSLFVSKERFYTLAAEYRSLAVYNFMRKSRAERAFRNYLKEKEFQNRLEFRLGIMPYGGVKVGFVYSF
jgi:hypothetical protein